MSQHSKSAALKTQIKNIFKSKAKIEEERRAEEERRIEEERQQKEAEWLKREEERYKGQEGSRKQELEDAFALRKEYTHFRILVIGRANAGKTTLLKRVCNTDEDPCIYDEENKNLVCFH